LRQNGAYPTGPVIKEEEEAVYFIIAVQMPLPIEKSVAKTNFGESVKSGAAEESQTQEALSAAGSKLQPLPNGASVAVTGLPAYDVNRNLVSKCA
jgi:hypothetical protein